MATFDELSFWTKIRAGGFMASLVACVAIAMFDVRTGYIVGVCGAVFFGTMQVVADLLVKE